MRMASMTIGAPISLPRGGGAVSTKAPRLKSWIAAANMFSPMNAVPHPQATRLAVRQDQNTYHTAIRGGVSSVRETRSDQIRKALQSRTGRITAAPQPPSPSRSCRGHPASGSGDWRVPASPPGSR